MASEKISVIVPVYNVELYLERCVKSIVYQSYKNLEIILVDDGSTDGSGVLCDELAEKYSRIRVIHKQNGGLSDARNTGMDAATGDVISFIDSDDYIHPEMYSVMLVNMNALGVDVIECVYKTVYNHTAAIDPLKDYSISISTRWTVLSEMIDHTKKHKTIACNKLYRRGVIEYIKFPLGKVNEDVFFINELLKHVTKIGFIDFCFYFYFKRDGSIMNQCFSTERTAAMEGFIQRYRLIKIIYPDLCCRMLAYLSNYYFTHIKLIITQGHDKDYKIRKALTIVFLKLYDELMNCPLIVKSDKDNLSEAKSNTIEFLKKYEVKFLHDKYYCEK